MVGKILWRSFWSWWDNLSYSFVTALIAAVNPSFLVLLPTVAFLLTTDAAFVQRFWQFWVVVVCASLGGLWLWPMSVVSHRMHEELMNGPVMKYFARLWEYTRQSFWSSLVWWLGGTLVGLVFGLGFAFYGHQMLFSSPVWGIVLFLVLWFFLLWVMVEMILAILIYKSGMKPGEMLLLAVYTVFRYAVVFILMVLVSWAVYGIFMIPAVVPFVSSSGLSFFLLIVPLVSVYGIGAVFHIWTFRFVFEEVPPESKKRSLWEIFTPFVQIGQWLRSLLGGRRR